MEINDFFSAVAGAAGSEDRKLIIAIAEFPLLIAAAICLGGGWKGKLVIYTGDNDNVQVWLRARKAGNPYARFLLRLLRCLEMHFQFVLIGVYVRSRPNKSADFLIRGNAQRRAEYAKALGLEEEAKGSVLGAFSDYLTKGYQ